MENTKKIGLFVTGNIVKKRIKILFPFLICAYIISSVVPPILEYVLQKQLGIFELPSEVWGFFIPIIFTTLIIYLLFRNKVKELEYVNPKNHMGWVIVFFASLGVMGSGMFAQSLFKDYSHSQLSNIIEIKTAPKTTYYSFDSMSFDFDMEILDKRVSSFPKTERSEVNIEYFYLVPFIEEDVTSKSEKQLWYVKSYETEITLYDINSDAHNDSIFDREDSLLYLKVLEELEKVEFSTIKDLRNMGSSFHRGNSIEILQRNLPEMTYLDEELYILKDGIDKQTCEQRKNKPITGELFVFVIIFVLGLLPPFPFLFMSGKTVMDLREEAKK